VNTCISAVQHLRPLRGGAQSHLLKASDGACYVSKFGNNPQHIRVLANEMLASNLGLALGLPMPRAEERSEVDRRFEILQKPTGRRDWRDLGVSDLAHAVTEPVADQRPFIHKASRSKFLSREKVRDSRTRSNELTGFS
jgi:hypothetical protein